MTLGDLTYLVIVPAFALLVFLVHRTTFAVRPKTCLWLTAEWLLPVPQLLGENLAAAIVLRATTRPETTR